MPAKLSLTADHAHLLFHDDGLLDLFAGLLILGFGLGLALNLAYYGGLLLVLILPLYLAAKSLITAPRLTQATKDELAGHSRLLRLVTPLVFLLSLILVCSLGLAFFDSSVQAGQPELASAAVFLPGYGLLWAGLMLLTALGLATARWVVYGGIALLTCLIGFWLGMPAAETVSAVGVILTAYSLRILIYFLRLHPLPPDRRLGLR